MNEPREDEAPQSPEAPPRPLLGPVFWVLIGFSLFCVALGAAATVLLPRLPL